MNAWAVNQKVGGTERVAAVVNRPGFAGGSNS